MSLAMPQPDRFTTVLPGNNSREHASADVEAGVAKLARDVAERIGLALEYGTDAAFGTGSRASNVATNGLSTDGRQSIDDLSRAVSLPPLPPHRPLPVTLHALQEWEGYVVEIGEEEFVARPIDITAGASYEEEEATIPISDLSDSDAARMQKGSIFRWVVGYERSAVGTKKRVSRIVFRDLPAMTESDCKAGAAWARETMRAFDPR